MVSSKPPAVCKKAPDTLPPPFPSCPATLPDAIDWHFHCVGADSDGNEFDVNVDVTTLPFGPGQWSGVTTIMVYDVLSFCSIFIEYDPETCEISVSLGFRATPCSAQICAFCGAVITDTYAAGLPFDFTFPPTPVTVHPGAGAATMSAETF